MWTNCCDWILSDVIPRNISHKQRLVYESIREQLSQGKARWISKVLSSCATFIPCSFLSALNANEIRQHRARHLTNRLLQFTQNQDCCSPDIQLQCCSLDVQLQKNSQLDSYLHTRAYLWRVLNNVPARATARKQIIQLLQAGLEEKMNPKEGCWCGTF